MRRVLLLYLAGCAGESDAIECVSMVEGGTVEVDELSTVGVTPAEVIARVQEPLVGTIVFASDFADAGAGPIPADLQMTFVQAGDAVGYEEPPEPRSVYCGGVEGPHLAVNGALTLEVAPHDGSEPFILEDHDAALLAYAPDVIAPQASQQDIDLPRWLEEVAALEDEFADPSGYSAMGSLSPRVDESSSYSRDILMSSFGISVAVHGHSAVLARFEVAPADAE